MIVLELISIECYNAQLWVLVLGSPDLVVCNLVSLLTCLPKFLVSSVQRSLQGSTILFGLGSKNLCFINVLFKLFQIVSGRHKLGMSALPHLTGVVVVFVNQ
jgi:hypothetical protein